MRFSRLLEGRFQNMLLQVRVRCERLLSAPNAKMCLLQHRSLRAAIRCGQRESPVGTHFSNALVWAYSVNLWARGIRRRWISEAWYKIVIARAVDLRCRGCQFTDKDGGGRKLIRILATAMLMFAGMPAAAQDCGPESPCEIDGGSYHLRVPEGEGPHPVLIWYHGYRGNGASIHRSGGLQRDFLEQGYALLAPNGYQSGDGPRSYPSREGAPRDDVAFTFAVLEYAGTRAEFDLERVYAAGFSAGGSMAWLLACEAGDHLAGMVSVAGALRRPNLTDCAGLAGLPVMQIHGFADGQVPLEERSWHCQTKPA